MIENMTDEEMKELALGMSMMFREYVASLPDVDEWLEGYMSPKKRATRVFEGLLAWLEADATSNDD